MTGPRASRLCLAAWALPLLAVAWPLAPSRARAGGPRPAALAPPAVVPLRGTEPPAAGAPRAEDLAPLAEWLGGARVVGLGESVHGTHTLHRLAHRLFAHLAADAGFDVLALEIDQAHAARLDAWVQGEREDLAALLAERWWGSKIFYDEALVEVLAWMRESNRAAGSGRRLHVAGYDLKQPSLAARAVVGALAGLEPEAARRAEALYAEALAPEALGMAPNIWGYTGTLRVPLPPREGPAPVIVELETRAAGLTFGSVGVAHVPDETDVFVPSWLEPEPPGPTWRPVRRELEIPAEADALELVIWHRGNGTLEVTAPRVAVGGEVVPVDLAAIEPRPLMMPRLQVMDYRAQVVADAVTGRPVLRVTADPALDASLRAAAAAEALAREVLTREVLTREVLARAGDRLGADRRAWTLQAARLVTQAVQWRTLVERNRDVFLAENLAWLARTAFPGGRVLALGHVSHTERRPGRMGALLDAELGEGYRTVSMLAGSGRALYFGDVATLSTDAELEEIAVVPGARDPLGTALGKLHDGSFLVPLAEEAGRPWLESVHPRPAEAPDVVIRVDTVAPIRAPAVR